jgi:hypothetical protein
MFVFQYGNSIAATSAVDFVGCSLCFGSISEFAAFNLDFLVNFGLLSFAKVAVREMDSSSSNWKSNG